MIRVGRSRTLLACCAGVLLLALGAVRHPAAAACPLCSLWPPPSPAGFARSLAQPDPQPGSQPARMLAAADLRSGPGERYLVFAVARAGEEHTVLGRSSDGLWWRIDYGGQPAWVAAAQVETEATGVPIVRVGGEQL